MTDTLEKPVVDDLFLLEFNDDSEEECSHSGHGKDPECHEGPAKWWHETTCPDCQVTVKGYRCDKWRVVSMWCYYICDSCKGVYPAAENSVFLPIRSQL